MKFYLMNNRRSSLSCLRFSFGEMKRATNDFAKEILIEEAEFAQVYRGNISGSSLYNGDVAVKRMAKNLRGVTFQLQQEIQVLTGGHHPNVVSPVGYCDEEDEKLVVYEFMKNGSLYDCIYYCKDHIPCLTVEQRLEIRLGVANGLKYLHSSFDLDVVHYDLITENILLDGSLVPKISGVRFSRNHDAGPSSSSQQITDNMQGIRRNLAPECYESNYKQSQKADVYAFGVLLLEVLCERQPWNRLLVLGLPFVIRGELPEFTPQHVKENITPASARQCEKLISDCLEFNLDKRPSMRKVIDDLQSALQKQKPDAKDQNIQFQANSEHVTS